jgi:hypothetical protein
MYDLMHIALQTDSTRFVTLQSDGGVHRAYLESPSGEFANLERPFWHQP